MWFWRRSVLKLKIVVVIALEKAFAYHRSLVPKANMALMPFTSGATSKLL